MDLLTALFLSMIVIVEPLIMLYLTSSMYRNVPTKREGKLILPLTEDKAATTLGSVRSLPDQQCCKRGVGNPNDFEA